MSQEQFTNHEIDSILEQVREKRAGEAPRKPRRNADRELNAILQELGIDSRKQKKTAEPILVNFPGAEEEEQLERRARQERQEAPAGGAQPALQPAPLPEEDDEPFIEDLHAQAEEDEPPTLELPTIKAYTEAEAQKQEEERRRIVEQAQRDAQNTIHNAAQFAMQMEISRQMAAINGEELPEEDDEPLGNNLFGEVDDQFRAFFGKTVVVDREAMEEAVAGHKKKKGFFSRIFARHGEEEDEPLTGEFDAIMPGTPGDWQTSSLELPPAAAAEPQDEPAPVPEVQASGKKRRGKRGKAADTGTLAGMEPIHLGDTAPVEPPAQERLPKLDTDTLEELGIDTSATAASERFRTAQHPRRRGAGAADDVESRLAGGGAVGFDTLVGEDGGAPAAPAADVLRLNIKPGKARRSRPQVDIPLDDEEEAPEIDEYTALSDAPVVAQNLASMARARLLRTAATGVIALVLVYMGLAAGSLLPIPALLDPYERPLFFLLANFVLLALSSLLSLGTLQQGFLGLREDPTTDSFVALADAGALLQNLLCLILETIPSAGGFDAGATTLFSPAAALLLFACALGKWMQIVLVGRNFALASSGSEHAAAFLMPQRQLVKRLCAGLGEPDPVLLVSRPTALVKGFLAQSFSARLYDAMAQKLSYVLGGAALVCALVAGIKEHSLPAALAGLAGALCLAAPVACTLVYAVPAGIMQKFASSHGAVIPGPSAIQALGRANTVLLNARDLFPLGSVRLHGIKTFEKERIDIAILYAASILVKHCDTLKAIFLNIIQNNTKLLYNVESVTAEAGYGFTGWIEHNRVIIGNREMMQRHDIEIPSMDYEKKYTQDGQRAPIYLAVSGKLFGMFIVSYKPSRSAAQILNRLTAGGISVLVQSEDFNVTSELVSATYRIPRGTVKVLSQPECDALNAETAYRATSEGVMIHDGSCASFLAGMRAASCAAQGERLARLVQAGAICFGAAVSVVLAFCSGLAGLGLGVVLTYQLAWTAFTIAMPLLKRP